MAVERLVIAAQTGFSEFPAEMAQLGSGLLHEPHELHLISRSYTGERKELTP